MTTHAEHRVDVGDAVNVGDTERVVSAIVGGALTVWGLSRLSLPGLLVAAVDAGGAHRNVGNLGVKIDESIVVNAPAQRVYDVWHTLENLPRLLSHVERVEVLDRTRSRWTVKGPAGTRISWEAELINDKPGEVIAWRTTDSTLVNHAGSVTFEEGRLAAWPGGSTVAGQRAPIPARRHPWIPIDCPGRPCRPATTSGSSRTSRRSPSVARRPSPSR